MTRSWPEVLNSLVRGDHLDADATRWAMSEILTGNATPVQVAGFAVALRAKGETVDELVGLSTAMLEAATPLDLPRAAVDIVGSGGDRANTVNISTMAAIVAAGAGATVVKHGNRAASSACGSADVIEALGVKLAVEPSAQPAVLDECGIVFLFAPTYHPSLRHAAVPRRELGIATVFNFLGPLANPARPDAMAVGVADVRMAELVAGVYAARGNRGLVFHGTDGLDELTTTSPSRVWLISDGRVVETVLDPADLGIAAAQHADLVGGVADHNAQVVRDLLDGASGPVRDIVLLNAAAALLAFDGPDLDTDPAPQLAGGLERAAAAVDSGAAKDVLARWVTATAAS